MSAVRIESLQTTYSRVDQHPILTPVETPVRIGPIETFAQTINRKIKERKISLGAVELLSGVNKSTVLRLKSEERKPKISTILKLDEALDFSPYEIFGWLLAEGSESGDDYYVARYLTRLRRLTPDWEPDSTVNLAQGETPQEKFQEYRGYKKIHEIPKRVVAVRSGGLIEHTNICKFESGNSDMFLRFFLGLSVGVNLTPKQTLDFYCSFKGKNLLN